MKMKLQGRRQRGNGMLSFNPSILGSQTDIHEDVSKRPESSLNYDEECTQNAADSKSQVGLEEKA